ncbi:MAG: bifunctional 5,10-methylenetetrahydrofolate dehydrogenase/5,10-methenyltetrahydrofolate cyclohydrolase [Acholeplasmataceae bacterium]
MELLSGKIASKAMKEILKEKIEKAINIYDKSPCLAVILIGNNPSSLSYIKGKEKACVFVGIEYKLFHLDEQVEQKEVEDLIQTLNQDHQIDGMILQLPIPKNLDENKLIDLISRDKDADGFHVVNQGYLYQKKKTIYPATPKGIMELLDYYKVRVEGLNATIIGRSNIVGFPVARMLMDRGATITVCHSKTKNLKEHTLNADLIVSATGRPKLVTKDMVKLGAIVIDVGINKVDGHLVGDVDFENVSKVASMITPVPGGVGPMTIYGLLENTYELYLAHQIK